MNKKISLSLLSCLIISVTTVYICFNIKLYKRNDFINNDVVSYYSYLPAAFIHNDLHFKFTDHPHEGIFWPTILDSGNKIIKTSCGMSLAYTPFFLLGHSLAHITNNKKTGFTWPYGMFLILGTAFYISLAFVLLQKILLHYFKDTIVAITLLLLYFGTNLLHYSTNDPLMSHAYSFSFSIYFLYSVFKWYQTYKVKHLLWSAVMLGILVLIRPTNLLFILLFYFWGVDSSKLFWQRIKSYCTNWKKYNLIFLVVLILVYLPQLLYIKKITGVFFINSYIGESFFFNNPHIIYGLFGYRNSVFLYTPVLLLCIPGFYFLYKYHKPLFAIPVLYIFIFTYVVFSWWCWWYGGSFGSRAYIDCYAILSLPLAALLASLEKIKLKRLLYSIIIIFFIGLNVANIFRYKKSWIHYSDMTSKTYWQVMTGWGGFDYFDLKHPDYEKAKCGEEEY